MSEISYRRIAVIALPVIAANVLLPLQGIIDTAIVGHFSSAAPLSGLGLANTVFTMLYVSFNFLQYATSGQSAQALGQQDYRQLQRILWRAFILVAMIGTVLLLFRPLVIGLAKSYFSASEATENAMASYIHLRLYSVYAELALYSTLGWFAGQSRSFAILIQQAVLTFSNILLSLWLVYGWHLGIKGVALGTVCANYLALGVSLVLVYRAQHSHQLFFFRPDWQRIFQWQEIRVLLSLNRDLFIRTAMLVLCLSWFQRLASALADDVLAANIVLMQLLNIATYALDGVAVAAEGLTGQAIGENKSNKLQQVIQKTLISGGVLAFGITAIYAFIVPLYVGWMTDNEAVQSTAQHYWLWAVFLPLSGVWGYLLDGYYFGATKAIFCVMQ